MAPPVTTEKEAVPVCTAAAHVLREMSRQALTHGDTGAFVMLSKVGLELEGQQKVLERLCTALKVTGSTLRGIDKVATEWLDMRKDGDFGPHERQAVSLFAEEFSTALQASINAILGGKE